MLKWTSSRNNPPSVPPRYVSTRLSLLRCPSTFLPASHDSRCPCSRVTSFVGRLTFVVSSALTPSINASSSPLLCCGNPSFGISFLLFSTLVVRPYPKFWSPCSPPSFSHRHVIRCCPACLVTPHCFASPSVGGHHLSTPGCSDCQGGNEVLYQECLLWNGLIPLIFLHLKLHYNGSAYDSTCDLFFVIFVAPRCCNLPPGASDAYLAVLKIHGLLVVWWRNWSGSCHSLDLFDVENNILYQFLYKVTCYLLLHIQGGSVWLNSRTRTPGSWLHAKQGFVDKTKKVCCGHFSFWRLFGHSDHPNITEFMQNRHFDVTLLSFVSACWISPTYTSVTATKRTPRMPGRLSVLSNEIVYFWIMQWQLVWN